MAYTKEMVFQQKLLEKSVFHRQNDWSDYGPAGQFLLLERAQKEASLKVIVYCQFNKAYKTTCDE